MKFRSADQPSGERFPLWPSVSSVVKASPEAGEPEAGRRKPRRDAEARRGKPNVFKILRRKLLILKTLPENSR